MTSKQIIVLEYPEGYDRAHLAKLGSDEFELFLELFPEMKGIAWSCVDYDDNAKLITFFGCE